MKILQYLLLLFSFEDSISVRLGSTNKMDVEPLIVNYPEEEKIIFQQKLEEMILEHGGLDQLDSELAGDENLIPINDLLKDYEFKVPINQTKRFGTINLTVGTATCGQISVGTVDTSRSGNIFKKYDISLTVSGITMTCSIDYR